MYETTFGIENGSELIPTDGRTVRVDLWCNDHCDLVRAVGDDAPEVVEDIDAAVGVADRIVDGGEHVVVTDRCLAARRSDNIERYMGTHGCLLLPPLQYTNGQRVCRILALDPGALSDLYAHLLDDGYEVTVRSKRRVDTVARDTPVLDPAGIVPELTARQREVLIEAIDRGYYEIPRETTTGELAGVVGVERRTVEDHLRRAERKTVEAMHEYLD